MLIIISKGLLGELMLKFGAPSARSDESESERRDASRMIQ